jgi:seryl-tRNA synthetase
VIDLKTARQEPERYRTALARRGAAEDFDALLEADSRWRTLTEQADDLRARQRKASKAPPKSDEIEGLKQLKADLARAEEELAAAAQQRQGLLDRIPNLPGPTAADGMTEEDAQLVRAWGGLRSSVRNPAITWRSPRRQDGSTWREGRALQGRGSRTGSVTWP